MTFIFIYLVSNTSMCHRIASLHSLRYRQRRHIWFLVVVYQAIAHALVCCSVLAFIYSCIFSISPFDSIFCFNGYVCLCLIRSDFAFESMWQTLSPRFPSIPVFLFLCKLGTVIFFCRRDKNATATTNECMALTNSWNCEIPSNWTYEQWTLNIPLNVVQHFPWKANGFFCVFNVYVRCFNFPSYAVRMMSLSCSSELMQIFHSIFIFFYVVAKVLFENN